MPGQKAALMQRDDRFLKREYLKILPPVMLSVLGGTVNALVDSLFVSQKLGSKGLAAVNMSSPVYLILCTFGSLIAAGAAVLSSQSAGEDDLEGAKRRCHTALTVSLVVGLVLTAVGLLLCRPLSQALAQNGELEQYVFQYTKVTIVGALPLVLLYIPLSFLQLEGKTKAITLSMLIMIGADVFLDWLLLHVFEMGMSGAALASVVSSLLVCVFGFAAMEIGYSNYNIRLCKVNFCEVLNIVRCGSPAALGNFLDCIKLLSLNAIILHYGGADAAAVWAVLNCLCELSLSITSGVPRAALPVMGAYYISRENSGLRILIKLQIVYGLALCTVFSAVIIAFHQPLELVFSSPTPLLLPFVFLSIYILLELLCSILANFFNASDRLLLSDILVFCRKFVYPVLVALLLVKTKIVWAFLPLGNLLSLVTAVFITLCVSRKKHELSPLLLLDDTLERENKVLDFSITPTDENICTASEQIQILCQQNNISSKLSMRLQLALEELLTVLKDSISDLQSVDLRVFAYDENVGIRIRCEGQPFDPFAKSEQFLGVQMLKRMAKKVSFTYSFGMNIINLCLADGEDLPA